MDLPLSIVFFVCLIVAVIIHEVTHGLVAYALGDDTAKLAGRLTLNPIPHIDPFGSIVLPAIGALTGLPVLAFAKPVPVNVNRLRNPRRDILLVSLAGPGVNLLMMGIAAVAAKLSYENITLPSGSFRIADLPLGFLILFSFALVNLFLGIFNLLPIPPLDGSVIIEPVLPKSWLPAWYRFRPYGLLVLFMLVFWTGLAGRVLEPFYRELIRFIFGS